VISLPNGLPEASFAVNWDDPQSPSPTVLLTRPNGQQVTIADSDVILTVNATHTVYQVTAPVGGSWKLGIRTTRTIEFLAVASANTDVQPQLVLGLPPAARVVGSVMPIYLALTDEVGPIAGANVVLTIERPDGSLQTLTMRDDGKGGDNAAADGFYTARYPIPAAGIFRVRAKASGIANDTEPFERYLSRSFSVAKHPRVAYVVAQDSVTANQYRELLQQGGFAVTQIALGSLAATNLSGYDLVIVGPDTGSGASWGDAAAVTALRDSHRPVLGLGTGGNAFFGKLGLPFGYSNATPSTGAATIALDPSHPLWGQPYAALADGQSSVTVYKDQGSPGVIVQLLPNAAAERLGRRSDTDKLYWLARQRSYMLWGFNLGPDAMTNKGKALFLNAAWLLIQ
jgi:hypothetical protein